MQIRDLMTDSPRCCAPEVTLQQAAAIMAEDDFGAIPVVENDQPVGIVTDRDITVRSVARGEPPALTTVRDIMSTDCACVQPETEVGEAIRLMEKRQIRRLVVTDDRNHVCGIVATADFARGLRNGDALGDVLEGVSKPRDAERQ